jgi:predicted DsbA family dithiol-disulfide isomerase
MLRRKYGREPQEIFARAEAAARETGLALDLSRQSRSHSTVLGHTLLRHAAAKGTQRALAKDLFVAHFIDAKTISDPKVLAEVAAPHGFSEEETRRLLNDEAELAATRREAQAASERGIHGVPFFVFGERFAFSGAQRQEVFHAAISRTLNDERKAP